MGFVLTGANPAEDMKRSTAQTDGPVGFPSSSFNPDTPDCSEKWNQLAAQLYEGRKSANQGDTASSSWNKVPLLDPQPKVSNKDIIPPNVNASKGSIDSRDGCHDHTVIRYQRINGKGRWKCHHCEKGFQTVQSLHRHHRRIENSHRDTAKLSRGLSAECQTCNHFELGRHTHHLINHLENYHHECVVQACRARFSSSAELYHHFNSSHVSQGFHKCPYKSCTYTGFSQEMVYTHFSAASHPKLISDTLPKRWFRCPFCKESRVFKEKTSFTNHLGILHTEPINASK